MHAMFQVVYLPFLNRLGFELLCINFAEYNLKMTLNKRKNAIGKDIKIADVKRKAQETKEKVKSEIIKPKLRTLEAEAPVRATTAKVFG